MENGKGKRMEIEKIGRKGEEGRREGGRGDGKRD